MSPVHAPKVSTPPPPPSAAEPTEYGGQQVSGRLGVLPKAVSGWTAPELQAFWADMADASRFDGVALPEAPGQASDVDSDRTE